MCILPTVNQDKIRALKRWHSSPVEYDYGIRDCGTLKSVAALRSTVHHTDHLQCINTQFASQQPLNTLGEHSNARGVRLGQARIVCWRFYAVCTQKATVIYPPCAFSNCVRTCDSSPHLRIRIKQIHHLILDKHKVAMLH